MHNTVRMSKEFTCNRGKNETNGPCKVRLYYDPQVLSQHGRQMPLEVDTGKPHNCSFGRGVLDHPDIVKDYEKAWQYWEEKDVEKLRNEFKKWKDEKMMEYKRNQALNNHTKKIVDKPKNPRNTYESGRNRASIKKFRRKNNRNK